MMKGRYGYRMGSPWAEERAGGHDGQRRSVDATGFNMHMGMTAENVCTNETLPEEVRLQPHAVSSWTCLLTIQDKAARRIADGAFKDEIVPVVIIGKQGDTVFDTDEGPPPYELPRGAGQAEALPFMKDGIVTPPTPPPSTTAQLLWSSR